MPIQENSYSIDFTFDLNPFWISAHRNSDFLNDLLSDFQTGVDIELARLHESLHIKRTEVSLSAAPHILVFVVEGESVYMPNDEFLLDLWRMYLDNEVKIAEKSYETVSKEIERLYTRIRHLEREQQARYDFLLMKRQERNDGDSKE